jgi:hypothetical protein
MLNQLLIQKLIKVGNKQYYKMKAVEGQDIIFSVFMWEDSSKNPTDEEIELALFSAKLPSYIAENHSLNEELEKPLAIFELEIYNNQYHKASYLKPLNMSLWEYEYFIKGNTEIHPALRSAFISKYSDDTLLICCESYDNESMLTAKNRSIINQKVVEIEKELLEVTGRNYLEVEMYY